jgi:hypothetical protein
MVGMEVQDDLKGITVNAQKVMELNVSIDPRGRSGPFYIFFHAPLAQERWVIGLIVHA